MASRLGEANVAMTDEVFETQSNSSSTVRHSAARKSARSPFSHRRRLKRSHCIRPAIRHFKTVRDGQSSGRWLRQVLPVPTTKNTACRTAGDKAKISSIPYSITEIASHPTRVEDKRMLPSRHLLKVLADRQKPSPAGEGGIPTWRSQRRDDG